MTTAPGTTAGPPVLHHWIGGREHESSSARVADVTDPATGQLTARVALATPEDVTAAVAGARAAFPGSRDASLAHRTQVPLRFRELLNARADELAALITAEHGKVLPDARGEVARGQKVVEFACGIAHLLKAAFPENASTEVDVTSIRQPLGPVAVISPFDFPGHGAHVVLPPRHRRGQHGRAQAEREGAVGCAVAGAAPRASTSPPAARSSSPAGSTRPTGASTSASRRMSDPPFLRRRDVPP